MCFTATYNSFYISYSSFQIWPQMVSPSSVAHPALHQLRIQLQSIHDAISNFQPLTSKPPILDSSLDIGADSSEEAHWLQQEHIPGLKKLRDSVKIDLDVLEKVGFSLYSKSDLSVVDFWNFSSFSTTPSQPIYPHCPPMLHIWSRYGMKYYAHLLR